MKTNKDPEYLYHFTSIENLREILNTGIIKLCPSNLLKPINPHIVNDCLLDETDQVKPVVWFSNDGSFEHAVGNGLSLEKTQAVIVVPTSAVCFTKWDEWAVSNHIDCEWFEVLKNTALNWESFYVSELAVPITEEIRIAFNKALVDC